MSRWRAETMPAVTVPPSPKGLPIAITQSPIRVAFRIAPSRPPVSGFVALDLEQRQVGLLVAADQGSLERGLVGQATVDLVGARR